MTAAIAPLAAGGRAAAVEVLARAFRDNPINRAVVGGGAERRLRANRVGLRSSLAACEGRSWVLAASTSKPEVKNPLLSAGDEGNSPRGSEEPEIAKGSGVYGVLVALPPGCFPLRPPSLFAQLRTWIAPGARAARGWAEVYRRLEEVHPPAPHWYLSLLGVDPAHQCRGLGRALLEIWLESVDRTPAASYLETDRARNVGFYRRSGFDLRAKVRVFETDVWCMWRPPVGPGSGTAARCHVQDSSQASRNEDRHRRST